MDMKVLPSLGRALVTFGSMPDQPNVTTKGAIGYAGNPQESINLLLAADSAFDVVEQAMPQCEVETEQYRRVPYVPLVNPAIHRTLGLITKRDHSMAPAARTLFGMLTEALVPKEGGNTFRPPAPDS